MKDEEDIAEALEAIIWLVIGIIVLSAGMALAQPSLNLNQQPIVSRQSGARLSTTRQFAIDCQANMTCVVDGGVLLLSSSGGGGGGSGAPVDAGYVVWSAAATTGSTNERVLTAGTNVTISNATPGQVIISASGGASSDYDGGYLVVEDEGVALTRRSNINFTGSGVTCADTGGKTVCTVSGGGGGSVNTATGTVTFDGGSLDAYTTVTAAWASPSSVIVCVPTGEEASVEGLITTVSTKGSGSFVVRAEPRNGTHWGSLPFECVGN